MVHEEFVKLWQHTIDLI